MKKITYLILVLLLVSCNLFKEKKTYTFTYEFENEISQRGISETIAILNKRLDRFGVEHTFKIQKGNKLNLKIKAFDLDSNRLNSLVVNQGKLEFWELYKGEEFTAFLQDIERMQEVETATDSIAVNSLLSMVAPSDYQGGPVVFQAKVEDTTEISSLLNKKESRLLLSSEYSNVKFLWGIPDENKYLALYAAKPNRDNKPSLTGELIVDATHEYDHMGNPTVSITMNKEGALRWERITGKAFTNRTCIAVTLNDLVYTAPGVTVGVIKGGRSQISGNFTLQEAQDLAVILSSQGSIPKLKLVNK